MSLFKKACALLGAIAIVSTSIVATTVMAEEVNPTIYMDYAIEESNLVVNIKAKDCPAVYEQNGYSAPYAIQMAEIFVNVNAGAEGNYTLPTSTNAAQLTNATWLKNKFVTSGWASPVAWKNGYSGTADDTQTYLVFNKMYGTDAIDSFGTIDEDGNATIATFKLALVDPTNIDTTITVGRADLSIWNKYDEEMMEIFGGESQKGYSTVNQNLNVEPLTIKVGGSEEPPVDDNTVAFEGFTGTKENGEADGSVSVATKKTFSGAAGANKILWTVNLKEGGKGTYESTVNLDGEADYTLGMIINGLAKELVASIEAVLAQ